MGKVKEIVKYELEQFMKNEWNESEANFYENDPIHKKITEYSIKIHLRYTPIRHSFIQKLFQYYIFTVSYIFWTQQILIVYFLLNWCSIVKMKRFMRNLK